MQNAPQRMNKLATCTPTRAKSVQARSPDVLRDVTMDIEDTRRQLIAKRVAAGADSQIGHRCSNLIEQLDNLASATGDQRVNLIKLIEQSIRELNERHQ